MTIWHPRPDDAGRPVAIRTPHVPSPLAAWSDPLAVACAVPGGLVPPVLNGIALAPWTDAPGTDEGWERLASASPMGEPAFDCPTAFKPAAGALVLERDGRAWCVAPTGGFGGHEFTLPKGRIDGRSLAATALVEVFEESGLYVRLVAFLCDVRRKETYTRFFLAERIGGSPADLTWESQASVLAPLADLRLLLTHPGDLAVLVAHDAMCASGQRPRRST
ncbi:NUDIX hydrolase [Variovorax sp. RB2P76]|uniref:NUDIX hydrolase n=1 Tax=Variovorax sp. RB2P76 TaxID=3443736 RepID=UPI003F471766